MKTVLIMAMALAAASCGDRNNNGNLADHQPSCVATARAQGMTLEEAREHCGVTDPKRQTSK